MMTDNETTMQRLLSLVQAGERASDRDSRMDVDVDGVEEELLSGCVIRNSTLSSQLYARCFAT
jgi:hypothetical protein